MEKYLIALLLVCSLIVNAQLFAEPVNVNTATAEKLAENLQGVGIEKANAIIEYRSQHGEFNSIEELQDVKGLGPVTLEKNKANILFK